PYEELGLAEDKFTDDQLIDFMLQHPILINRPIVVTPLGTRLCRPSEVVLDILPDAQKGAFAKEGANKQVISSQADSLIKISRIWADFFPAN
ncbi:ArsC/Spx/MgsR family protein, partial [Klebsiella variicola subsp. variicola]